MMHGAIENITQAFGNTPIVRLNRVTHGLPCEIYVKCEYLNPGGSHKDRLAWNMIRTSTVSRSRICAASRTDVTFCPGGPLLPRRR